ncbi:MAG: hypothetical protein PHO54_04365 [Candidatus Peribacteraceae bacterium]|nr:hypothetical protein [Candidatus Peribacteraceae bacterium]
MKSRAILEPRLMRIAVLTAALQDVVPRDQQRQDPKGSALIAALKWIEVAKMLGFDLQLSAALALADAYVPPEAMLDPVAHHVPLRTMSATEGEDLSEADAQTIIAACGNRVKICDLGFFENLLHPVDAIREKIHAHLLRVARAAKLLVPVGCGGVTGFIGRDPTRDLDQNVASFESLVIPLLQQIKALGLNYWIENCPMPGWNTTDTYVNNIAYCPGMWLKLLAIAEKYGVDDMLHITYDESHDILMGSTHAQSFAAVAAAGHPQLINRFHGKNQYVNHAARALWNVRGQGIDLGCRIDGQPHPDPAKQGGAWGVMTCNHGMIGLGHYNPVAQVLGYEADWLDHQVAAREVLGLDPVDTYFILEHEWGNNRVQDWTRIIQMLSISVRFIRGIDAAADALSVSKVFCDSFQIPLPGTPNPAYVIAGLAEAAKKIMA